MRHLTEMLCILAVTAVLWYVVMTLTVLPAVRAIAEYAAAVLR